MSNLIAKNQVSSAICKSIKNSFFSFAHRSIYYSSEQLKNQDFKGPDFFVVLDTDGQKSRKSWIVWEENGRYPDVIIELMSPSTTNTDLGEKKCCMNVRLKR